MEYTTEDQLVSDLVDYWSATPPTGLPAGIPFVHFRRNETLPIPAVIVGHDGFERETAKGMTGTGKVLLRVAIRTDLDITTAADHRLIASILDQAMLALSPGSSTLALTYLHAVLREAPESAVENRRQITVLRYNVVCTRMQPGA